MNPPLDPKARIDQLEDYLKILRADYAIAQDRITRFAQDLLACGENLAQSQLAIRSHKSRTKELEAFIEKVRDYPTQMLMSQTLKDQARQLLTE
jgi:hypothetical protein